MNNLDKVIPLKPTNYFSSLDIFTWNSSTDIPFKNIIGGARGAALSGGIFTQKRQAIEEADF